MKSIISKIRENIVLFGLGCVISIFSFFLIFLLQYRNESFIANDLLSSNKLIRSSFYCLCIAIIEEFLFRYLFLYKWIKNIHKGYTSNIIALCLVSSFVFGFLHLDLENFPIVPLNLTMAGISLFYATYVTRNISMAIGMHFSWNFIQGVVFNFQGSGLGLESIILNKETLAVKPEASPFMIFAVIFEILLIIVISKTNFSKKN